jgi:gluconokinase
VTKELVLGLDIGSSSVRGAFFDRERLVRASIVRRDSRLRTTVDRGSVIDAEELFKLVVEVIDELHSNPSAKDVIAIAPCAFWHGLVGTDAAGAPMTPILTWADNRSGRYAARLRVELHEKEVHDRTGCHFHSSYWPAKLLYLRAKEKDAWRRTAIWMGAAEFVAMRLVGRPHSSISMLSGTGIFAIREGVWDDELLKYLKLDAGALPVIGGPSPLTEKWSKRWPRFAEAVWHPAVGDGAANNIGSGAAAPGVAALMVGTSAAVRVVLDRPPRKIPAGLFCYRVDERRFLLGGALSDGGGLYDWLRRSLRFDISENAFAREIAKRGPGARGLTLMPFFAGERSTGYNENAEGVDPRAYARARSRRYPAGSDGSCQLSAGRDPGPDRNGGADRTHRRVGRRPVRIAGVDNDDRGHFGPGSGTFS